MLGKLTERLSKIAAALRVTEAALALAQKAYDLAVAREQKFKAKKLEARKRADEHRRNSKVKRAARKDARSGKFATEEAKARHEKELRRGEVKRLNAEVNELETTEAEIKARIKAISGPRVKGNKVVGGTPEQRLQKALLTAAAKCAAGSRRNFYSQPGVYDVEHAITGEPYGHRSDCSQFGAAIYHSCGLKDPNNLSYTGGYTGTLERNGRAVSREYARNHAGCAVLFGPRGATHHVEWSLGDGTEHTVGHGSAPVDLGTFDLLSGPVQFRAYDLG